jgi:hypothetical protein
VLANQVPLMKSLHSPYAHVSLISVHTLYRPSIGARLPASPIRQCGRMDTHHLLADRRIEAPFDVDYIEELRAVGDGK